MNPAQTLEKAFHAWLSAQTFTKISTSSIYKGLSNSIAIDDEETNTQPDSRVLPAVTIEAEGSHDEAVVDSRLFKGNLLVTVEADSFNTTDAAFGEICDEAFGKFNIQELNANVSAALNDFTLVYGRISQNGHAIKTGQNWQNFIRLECVYAEADI